MKDRKIERITIDQHVVDEFLEAKKQEQENSNRTVSGFAMGSDGVCRPRYTYDKPENLEIKRKLRLKPKNKE